MERRAFIALAAFAFIPTREHSDLKDLHERYRAAWADGREEEADALTFKLRNAIARKGVPDEWRQRLSGSSHLRRYLRDAAAA